MNSLDSDCNELKQKYDACFNVWFSEKFLKNNQGKINDDSMCKSIFMVYRECVRQAIAKQKIDLGEVDKKILGTPQEKKAHPQEEDSK